jgi:hypothetical protein
MARGREMKRATHYMLRNSIGWHCAYCAQLITSVSEGWVEWLASEDDQGATILSGLRLVHRESAGTIHGRCSGAHRVGIRNQKLERVVSLKSVRTAFGLFGAWFGLGTDDSPIMAADL